MTPYWGGETEDVSHHGFSQKRICEMVWFWHITLPKTNIAPENGWLED